MGPFIGVMALIVVVCVCGVVFALVENRPTTEMRRADVKLYRDAAKILNRLVNVTDLNNITDDQLTPETRDTINAWLTDYKKALKK